jgi:hypothetical protein
MVNSSYTLGLALFALGVIVFFGQRYVLGFANMIASGFPGSGLHEMTFDFYIAIYVMSVSLIVLGVVVFYRGRRHTSLTSSNSAEN